MAGDSVQQIKEKLSIIDVVSPYVELTPAGKHMKAKCPFHNEKTPSFTISPDRGMYYCYGCSKGGDMFTFVQEMEGVEFKDALKILAEKAGVELVKEDPQKRTERDTGYAVLNAATQFFEEKLSGRPEAMSYLTDRGVTAETIAKWRIGYAPGPPKGGWRDTRVHLQGKKYTDTQIQKVGLIKSTDQGKEPYDTFRDRIMFPIFDSSGKVIAYSGRILNKNSDAPKYVNSPETEFFNKSEALYGYDKAKQGIRKFDFSLIVEGQFDVVLCHQAGYSNTVAVSGTALTPHHVGLLQRLSNRVVLALDADNAGIKAVKRAAELMLARGIDVKVARIPDGSDPADLIKEDPKIFKDVIGHATHVIEFLLAILKEQTHDDRAYKLTVRDEVLPYIAHMENRIDAEHFEGVVAEAIGTTKDAIHLEVMRILENTTKLEKPKSVEAVIIEKQTANQIVPEIMTRREGLLGYLVIASELVDDEKKKIISSRIEHATGKDLETHRDEMLTNEKSHLMFTLESQFADLTPQQLIDELGGKFHEFILLSAREKIAAEKEILFAAEREGDAAQIEAAVSRVTDLQKKLAAASVVTNVFSQEIEG